MIKQMTNDEKRRLICEPFSKLWNDLWGTSSHYIHSSKSVCRIEEPFETNESFRVIGKVGTEKNSENNSTSRVFASHDVRNSAKIIDQRLLDQYKVEEQVSKNKFESLKIGIYTKSECYTLEELIKMTPPIWTEAEWGFPKGRRNYQERDYDCAIREFCEETGYNIDSLVPLNNIQPFEEIFTGSNYKSYKHKYYVTFMRYEDTLSSRRLQACEISDSEWMPVDKCYSLIRSYNVEKKRLLLSVEKMISENYLYHIC
jgi:hypothetical protein